MQEIVDRIRQTTTSPVMVSSHAMSDKAFLSRFQIKEVATLLDHNNTPAAKAALLEHYKRRVTPGWPTPPRTITDLRLNTCDLTAKELIARADSILHYRFSPEGTMPKMTRDGNIDWRSNPVSSPEWLWRLNRHQWWPILGLAYKHTGDERYTQAFVSQMLDWITDNPPPPRIDEKSPTWRLMEAGMRMYVSWIPTFALFYESPHFPDEAKLVMLRSIYDHGRFLSFFKTRRNHLLRESNGLAYVSAYFPELTEAKHWQNIALTRLEQELTKQINEDGSHIEVSTGYQWVVVDEFEKTYELLQSNNLALQKENLSSHLERMYHVLAYLVRPDGTFPEVNDGFIRWQYTRLAKAGEMLGRGDFRYIGTAGKHGTLPNTTSIGFDDAGLYVMRSDWTREARYLLFDAGPYGGPHGHEDKLSFELFAYGQAFIVDSGSYTYEKKDPFRTYFVSSQAHNTVLVDGQSQVRRWQRDNLNPKRASGNYATWVGRTDFDYAAARYTDGYAFFSFQKPKDPKIIQDVTHTRRILFVKPDYWIMVDELQASDPHSYQLLFHAPPDIKIEAGTNKRVVMMTAPDAASLYIIPVYTHNLKVSWLAGSEVPIQGWYSVDHHRKVPSPVVIYERANSLSTVLTTLLYPCPPGQNDDEVTIKPVEVTGGKGLAFAITTNRGRDYLMLSQDNGLKQFGPYTSKGTVAGIRTDNNGNVVTQFEWAAAQ